MKMAAQESFTYPSKVREQLENKTILVIGSGGHSSRKVWDIFNEARIKITLVTHEADNCEANKVDKVILYDYYTDQTANDKHVVNIVQLLGDGVGDIDGCFTFTEEDIPITAAICQKLGLRGVYPDAAMTVRSKQNTYVALRLKKRYSKYNTEKYLAISYPIGSEEDIKDAKSVRYPAILKPERHVGSRGVVKVISEEDCIQQYHRIQQLFRRDSYSDVFGRSMVLMEFLEGHSHEVDVVMYNGELVAAFITDIGLYLPETFCCTTTCVPSSICTEMQDQLKRAAYHCCYQIGLHHGVFNTEFKLTQSGPKLVEINGRQGSYRRCIIYQTTHGINLWEVAAAIACGIKPSFPKISTSSFAVGVFLYNNFHGKQFQREDVQRKLMSLVETKDIVLENRFRFKIEDIQDDNEAFLRTFCHLVALSNTSIQHARQNLIALYRGLGFTETDYNIERFTSLWA